MKREELIALELAVDQAADASAAYQEALQVLASRARPLSVSSPIPRCIAVAITNAETSKLYLREVSRESDRVTCERLPCDRQGGICPRCT